MIPIRHVVSFVRIKTVFCLFACLFLVACEQRQQRTIVVIGDGSGRDKQIGESIELGARVTAEQLAKLSDGSKFVVRFEDDSENDEIARKQALRALADPNVIAVIGHSASGTTGAALDIYGPEGMPLLLPVATNPDLTSSPKQRNWSNVLRLVPSDDVQASSIADFSRNYLQASNAVVVHDIKRYSLTLSESVSRALAQQRINVPADLAVEQYIRGNTDYAGRVRDIKQYSPDVIVFVGYYPEGGHLIKELRAGGIKTPVIVTDGCFPSGIFDEVGPSPGEVYACFVAPDWNAMTNATPLINDIRKMRANADVSYAPFAADAVRLIHTVSAELLARRQPVTRKTFLLQAKEIKSFDKGMIAGPYRFNSAGDNDLGRNHMYHLQFDTDGKATWKICTEIKQAIQQ